MEDSRVARRVDLSARSKIASEFSEPTLEFLKPFDDVLQHSRSGVQV
jgi:hypothetical protein